LIEVRTPSVCGPCEARDASPVQVPEGWHVPLGDNDPDGHLGHSNKSQSPRWIWTAGLNSLLLQQAVIVDIAI
jgi:hypothetical protein